MARMGRFLHSPCRADFDKSRKVQVSRPIHQGSPMFGFRTTITCAVMAFIVALAALLILIQTRTFNLTTEQAAASSMDAASAKSFGRLQSQISEIVTLVRVLSASPNLADSDQRTETDRGISLLTAALHALPQMDSVYVGYDSGSWLQIRNLDQVNDEQREKLRAPPGAAINIHLIRPTPSGALPLRRIFQDRLGDQIEQLDLWNYGYDARKRLWYRDTMRADRLLISSPYVSFSIATPVITVSAPLRGTARGVIAADLKLDSFSDFVNQQRPGARGIALIFDSAGGLIAHPDFKQFVVNTLTHPAHPMLPNVKDIDRGLVATVLKGWNGGDRYEGGIRDQDGTKYLFRLKHFSLDSETSGHTLLLAAQDDFIQDIQRVHFIATILALICGAAFIPAVWIFGSRMSRSLKEITVEAGKLQTMEAPNPRPVTAHIKEIHELGTTVALAQRAIWSFAHFVPKEIVRGLLNKSISTDLGGVRQEITIVFTDVRGFTTIAESSDPDVLMRQTSRYFTALTEAFLAEGGTVDKYIGDAVMVFWNAPHRQLDHVERACRAVLSGKQANEQLNRQFETEGLPPFITRFGIHVAEAVVGKLGSSERMEYTALGTAVNLASRLEGLNKDYGTSILVSEQVYARVQHRFRFRSIDTVVAKGMTSETRVYELVEASP
jgi:adenylate cyclase